jgi:hypothetical protein
MGMPASTDPDIDRWENDGGAFDTCYCRIVGTDPATGETLLGTYVCRSCERKAGLLDG